MLPPLYRVLTSRHNYKHNMVYRQLGTSYSYSTLALTHYIAATQANSILNVNRTSNTAPIRHSAHPVFHTQASIPSQNAFLPRKQARQAPNTIRRRRDMRYAFFTSSTICFSFAGSAFVHLSVGVVPLPASRQTWAPSALTLQFPHLAPSLALVVGALVLVASDDIFVGRLYDCSGIGRRGLDIGSVEMWMAVVVLLLVVACSVYMYG